MSVINLISDIKRKAQMGQSQQTITDADILDIANREMQSYMAPKLVTVQERYFSSFVEYQITATRSRYRIPSRCVGGRVLDVTIIASNGYEYRVPRLHPTENQRINFGFSIDGRDILLSQSTNFGGGVLRIYYQLRPSTLVTTVSGANVTAVSASNIATTLAAGVYDVIATTGLGQVVIPDAVGTGIGFMSQPTGWVVQQDMTNFVSVGDRAVASGLTDVVPLPLELHDVLAFRCAMRLKQMQGLSDDYASLRAVYEEVEAAAMNLVTPRSENAEKAIKAVDMLDWGI
jgi:hypothetical protein